MSDAIWYMGMTLDDLEKQAIEKAYRLYGQNKTATAASLGIAIRTLDAKLEKYKEMNETKEAAVKSLNRFRDEFGTKAKSQLDRNMSINVLEEKVPPEIIREEVEQNETRKLHKGKRN